MREPPYRVAGHGECGMDASHRFPHLAEVVAGSLTGEAGCPPIQSSDTNLFGGDASHGRCRCCGAPAVRGHPVVRTTARTQPSHPSWTPARVLVKRSGVQTGSLRGRVNRQLKAVRQVLANGPRRCAAVQGAAQGNGGGDLPHRTLAGETRLPRAPLRPGLRGLASQGVRGTLPPASTHQSPSEGPVAGIHRGSSGTVRAAHASRPKGLNNEPAPALNCGRRTVCCAPGITWSLGLSLPKRRYAI